MLSSSSEGVIIDFWGARKKMLQISFACIFNFQSSLARLDVINGIPAESFILMCRAGPLFKMDEP